MAGCLRTLHEEHEVDLLVVRVPPVEEAPFAASLFDWIPALYDRTNLSTDEMSALLQQFNPDGILISGWADSGYMTVARRMRRGGIPVIAGSDNQWEGTLRQHVARVVAPYVLHRSIDALWVAGERQRQFAARLGYQGMRCWDGIYACDWSRFARVHHSRSKSAGNGFLFVGRYLPVKGLDTLLDAYGRYRDRVTNPWPLICAGAGKWGPRLTKCPGVENRGFVQPDALPALMHETGAFVLPSVREPWGVVLQEAAAAGLPLIASEACGAAVHLLRDGLNGFTVGTGNVTELTRALHQMSSLSPDRRAHMRDASHALSRQYTPARWARTLIAGCKHLREARVPVR
jgi:glycosyltransferase involved in cell wall biosynthesis